MPVLDISSSKEDRFAFAMSGGRLLATMLFPSDDVTRERVTRLWGAVVKQHTGPAHLATDYQKATAAILSERYTLWNKPWRSGMAAGRILRLVRQMAEQRPESEASVGKAIHILENTHKILGQSMKRSVVRKAWSDFKSVAHLWAAIEQFELCETSEEHEFERSMGLERVIDSEITNKDIRRKVDLQFVILSAPQLLLFIAEDWRRFGETFANSREKSLLLDSNETWAAPDDYELSECNLEVPALTRVEIEALESYKAPTRN